MTDTKNVDFSHLGGIQVKEADETPDALDSVLKDLKDTELPKLSHLDALRLLARLRAQLFNALK